MKKILLATAAVMFLGSFVASAQIQNACRFKDANGNVWNGVEKNVERTSSHSNTGSVNGSAGYNYDGKRHNANVSVGGSYSSTNGNVSRTSSSECCKPNSNDCSDYYQKGHSDLAKNAEKSSW